jgi:hypothetical protein
MDINACVLDLANELRVQGRANGQRWTLEPGAIKAILEQHLAAPAPAKPAPKKKVTKKTAPKATTDDDPADA